MKFVALVVIASTQYEEKLKDIAKEAGAGGGTILQGKGSSLGEKKSFFALTFEGNQSVIIYILEEKLSRAVLKAINTEIQNNPTDCIAFTMPISHMVGLDRELLKVFEDSIKLEENL
ncbi:hypothetical protein [Sulfurimonas sp.]|jgi:hypothetical protein|uniref:hypothetical protein n=1 Tax=Sulfurimonas sp. TaxID=2022749 RepID=UPI0025E018A7|nr:hypothetical protein [Sulfurimonas sp.]MCK9472106.1 hypothetical protein [Sulfurimonas sp.]MDD3506060.1 hypothetical protein [Sulfurimonas sp.]